MALLNKTKNKSAGDTALRPLLIGGKWISATGHSITSLNPATGEENNRFAAAGLEEVDAAVRIGAEAARAPAWREMLPHNRARILSRIADGIENRIDDFAAAQQRENGKVTSECRKQAAAAADTFRYYAGVCETVGSELTPSRGGYFTMVVHEPYGVVGAITPWNSPLTMEAQKIAPALAAGNAVVLKPSEVTPSSGLLFGEVALEAGLPAGLLNVLPGTGAIAGRALTQHPGVGFVSFTGGTESGRAVARIAAEKLMPVALELGGKSPHIVFADANLEAAAKSVASGIFEGTGQSCIAGSRLLVERSVYERIVELVTAEARNIRIDMPDAPGADIGPLASFAHRERVERLVDSARNEGGTVHFGGDRPAGEAFTRGAFYRPTILTGLDGTATAVREEIFGPVLCVIPFDNEDDLLRQANGTTFGLAAGIWTSDYQRAWRVARKLDAGTVWINTYKALSISTPFGGFKESGFGREKGVGGMRLYQQSKGLYWGTSVPAIAESGR